MGGPVAGNLAAAARPAVSQPASSTRIVLASEPLSDFQKNVDLELELT